VIAAGDLPANLGMRGPGEQVRLEVWREGKAVTLNARLGDAAERVADAAESAAPSQARLGLALRPLQPGEGAQAKTDHGLVVEQSTGPAAIAGIRPGDVLMSVNGKPVSTVEEVRGLVAKSERSAALLIQRGGDRIFVPVHLG
jgi:serine protease Do